MIPGLVVVDPPAVLPVTLEEAKGHLRVDSNDDNATISAMIAAAVDYAELFTGRALVDQTLDLVMDAFPSGSKPIAVPRPPLIEVLGVFTRNAAGDETEVEGYRVETVQAPGRIIPSGSWPTGLPPAGVRIRYRAGYVRLEGSPLAPTGNIPDGIHAALLLYLGTLYEHRETISSGSVVEVPWGAEQLLRLHKVNHALA